jgi:Leucine-rich repeat (LRR) protein
VHEIDLTSCGLQNLTDFEFFRKLRVFKAHRNNIQVFNLELKYLEELDLSNNMVKQLPNLSLLPHIKHLRLNNNLITQLDFEIDSRDPKISSKNFSRLLTIELTGNLLQIESSDTYNQLIGVLTHFKNLEVLMIDHQKRQETAYVSQKLEKSNKKELSDKHEKLKEAYDQIRKALPLSVLQFNEPYEIPTFAKLFRRIEQANSMPNQVL